MKRLSRCRAVYFHGFVCSFSFPHIFLTASIFLEDSRVYFTPFRLFSFAPWDQRPNKLSMDSHQDAFHIENESVVGAHGCGEGGDTINGIQVTCKPEFTVSSLDSSAVIIFQRNHCLWHHFFFFFFVLTSLFFSSSFSHCLPSSCSSIHGVFKLKASDST